MRPRRNRKLHEDVSKRRNADPMPMPMIHTDTDRFVAFESIENGRELGGLAMRDGRKIQHNRLVRSGHLARASDGDVAMLKGRFGTSHVFDFRFDAETRDAEDRRMEGVCYTRLSTLPKAFVEGFTSGRADTARVKSTDFVELLTTYAFHPQAQEASRRLYPAIVMDSASQRLYGEFLRGVLQAPGGVLWHCSQGKDRAGWATAFVLAALGADRRTIVEDFDLSNKFYAPIVEKLSARVVEKGGGKPELEFIHSMVGVSTANFEQALDLIGERYGSLTSYIERALGMTAGEQEQLREKYLT